MCSSLFGSKYWKNSLILAFAPSVICSQEVIVDKADASEEEDEEDDSSDSDSEEDGITASGLEEIGATMSEDEVSPPSLWMMRIVER